MPKLLAPTSLAVHFIYAAIDPSSDGVGCLLNETAERREMIKLSGELHHSNRDVQIL